MYVTQAMQRIYDFFGNDANKGKMYRIAVQEVRSEAEAEDIVQDTLLSLIEKEYTGKGHFDEQYGSDYEAYIYGVFYGELKKRRKITLDISDSCFTREGSGGEESMKLIENIRAEQEPAEWDLYNTPWDTTMELISVCDECGVDVAAMVRMICRADELNYDEPQVRNFLRSTFSGLRKVAKQDTGVVDTIRDFMRLYGSHTDEVEECLAGEGVVLG